MRTLAEYWPGNSCSNYRCGKWDEKGPDSQIWALLSHLSQLRSQLQNLTLL